jgi:predicted nucleic acid-binding protein
LAPSAAWNWTCRRAQRHRALLTFLHDRRRHQRRVGADAAVAVSGRGRLGRDRAGPPIDGFDAQIASICRVHRAGLATRNTKDFQDTGIDVIDPWQPDQHAPP